MGNNFQTENDNNIPTNPQVWFGENDINNIFTALNKASGNKYIPILSDINNHLLHDYSLFQTAETSYPHLQFINIRKVVEEVEKKDSVNYQGALDPRYIAQSLCLKGHITMVTMNQYPFDKYRKIKANFQDCKKNQIKELNKKIKEKEEEKKDYETKIIPEIIALLDKNNLEARIVNGNKLYDDIIYKKKTYTREQFEQLYNDKLGKSEDVTNDIKNIQNQINSNIVTVPKPNKCSAPNHYMSWVLFVDKKNNTFNVHLMDSIGTYYQDEHIAFFEQIFKAVLNDIKKIDDLLTPEEKALFKDVNEVVVTKLPKKNVKEAVVTKIKGIFRQKDSSSCGPISILNLIAYVEKIELIKDHTLSKNECIQLRENYRDLIKAAAESEQKANEYYAKFIVWVKTLGKIKNKNDNLIYRKKTVQGQHPHEYEYQNNNTYEIYIKKDNNPPFLFFNVKTILVLCLCGVTGGHFASQILTLEKVQEKIKFVADKCLNKLIKPEMLQSLINIAAILACEIMGIAIMDKINGRKVD